MLRWLLLAGLALTILLFGFSLIDAPNGDTVRAQAQFADVSADSSGFARAIAPRTWQFPADFGAHPEFQTEWWYYTGNLADADGRHFGYQFTIFRRAITPPEAQALATATASEWRTDQLYMAHFALTDVDGKQYYHVQRFSRGAADLAGAVVNPLYRVWIENWAVEATDAAAQHTAINADAGDFAVHFTLEQTQPPALQGVNGLSAKGDEPGNASYYYSLPRLLTAGTLRVGETTYTVEGTTWKDHEFSTSALSADAQGWDWFGLQLDDGRELMLGQIRMVGGGKEPAFGGTLIYPDGSTRHLNADDFTFTVTAQWTSPHTQAVYPAGWDFSVNIGEAAPLTFTLTPLLADQELHGLGGLDYWEGAVRLSGGVTGYGYAELTGYSSAMTGRF